MHSHLDALQAMGPVGFRRGPSDFHSVAKQASFYIALGVYFQGFWEVWGGQLGVENRFLRVFFDIFSRSMLASIFNRFSEARNVKNSNFAPTGARFFIKSTFSKK